MQKIIEDREKRKKKWIRIGKISAVAVLSLIILIRLFCSSYAFCNWYLPLASYSLGIRISADEVKFTPFSSKRHLNFRGLQVEIKDKMIFTAQRFKTKISFFDLIFKQVYALDNVTVERAALVISDLRRTEDEKERAGLNRLRIGSVTINDLSLRYAPERSAVFGKAFFQKVRINSLLPEQWNAAEFQSLLAWDMPDSSMINLPVSSKINFMLNQELSPVLLQMNIETQNLLSGNIYDQDLAGLRLKAFLDCKIDDNEKITINQAQIQQFNHEKEVFKLNALGFYDIENQAGSMQITAAADRMSVALLPLEYIPEDMNLRFNGTLLKNKNSVTLESQMDLNAEAILKNQKEIIPEPKLHLRANLVWDIEKKNLTLSKCLLEASSRDIPHLTVKTSENFAIAIDQDTSWSVAPADSSLQLIVKECPLSFLNHLLPLQFKNGTLSLCYDLNINAEKQSLNGIIKGSAKDVELQNDKTTIFKKLPIHFEGKLHSNGLDKITDLNIPNITISCGQKPFATLQGSGKAHFLTDELELNGILKTDLQALLQNCTRIDQSKCRQLRATFGDCITRNEHAIRLNYSDQTRTLEFSIQSLLNNMTLPMMEKNMALTLDCNGAFINLQDRQIVKLNDFSISAPEALELTGSAEMLFPQEAYTAKFNLKKISPQVLRGILLACELQSSTKEDWIRKMYFENLTATANFALSGKERSLHVSNVTLNMLHKNGGTGSLVLHTPITGTFAPLKLNDVPASAVFKKFPLEYFNTFTEDQCRLKILPAELDSEVKLTFTDSFKNIPFQAKGHVNQLHCMDLETPYDFGSCSFSGEADLNDYFGNITARNAILELTKEKQKQLVYGSGHFLLDFPYTCNMQLQLKDLNGGYAATFFPALSALVNFKEAQTPTQIQIQCDQDYDLIKVLLDQDIRKLTPHFPDDATETPPILHGNIHLDMLYHVPAEILSLNKSNLKLFNEKKKLLYHAELHGEWDGSKNNRSYCSFTSDAADLRTAYLAFKATRKSQQNKEEEEEENAGEKAVAAIQNTLKSEQEPGAVELNGFSTKLDVNIKDWTYSDELVFAMKGLLTVHDNIFSAQKIQGTLNDASYQLNANADLGKNDGWEIKLQWLLNDLDLTPLINTFGSSDLKERKITGKINKMELNLSTKGVTNNSLDKNLTCNAQMDFTNISFPFIKENDEKSAWQTIMTPLLLFPRFYDLIIPPGKIRDRVQKALGGAHIDVLMGERNIELDRGTLKLKNSDARKTDLMVTKFLFAGPVLQVASKDFMINPFHNRIKAGILTKFGGMVYPIKLDGPIDKPEVELPSILGNTLKGSLQLLNVFREDDPVWQFDTLL